MALSFLDRERSVAHEGYSRWLVPPAALAIHLSIGQVYAFSVFKNPLQALTAADGSHWDLKSLGYIFSIAIAVLGLSAAIFGAWLEKVGPRRAMFYAAICFAAGFYIAAIGADTHQIALIYLGYGVVGGVGLGLGYISPVSTLIKWFPDRPGLATGLAIMGFGGGALIGSPLANQLMAHFKAAGKPAIPSTFLVMGTLYFIFMMFGVFTIRVPRDGWKPEGWSGTNKVSALISTHSVAVGQAWRTPQFALLWIILFCNVTAGIGILEQASPMIQDLFKGSVGKDAAVGFVGLLSIFNMAGRFFWASVSDKLGRKTTYFTFFTLGAVLFFVLPLSRADHLNSVPLFVSIAVLVISMYGGGFATIPAYLKDLFGGYNVSAIHGRLLTAWSTAGIVGPLIVNGILDHYVANHMSKQDAYPLILHIMSGLLVVGFVANLLVRPVDAKHWMKDQTLAPVGGGH
ncbi:Major Facilitator Superfamily protein [Granulicella rosea]|uniref:Major Facilitator Superfamily protein n=1 Tax=Granulicella rosea TaxID=474952 RepID=A0A239I9D7_9BACT|nr:OFA family MFS transporter [Granulicella rosea]SNS90195.1 Major Facilitator Superfamily protein [Granulicella rosea]